MRSVKTIATLLSLSLIPVTTGCTTLSANSRDLPERRYQVSLNGAWQVRIEDSPWTTIEVPSMPLGGARRSVYRRRFDVPASAAGRRIILHFGAVYFKSTVFVNGRQAGNPNMDGYLPFERNITDLVSVPSTANTVEVRQESWQAARSPTDPTRTLYPVGGNDHIFNGKPGGIWQSVWLKAVPATYIEDVFVQTSYRNKTIRLDISIRNESSVPREIEVDNCVLDKDNGVAKLFPNITARVGANISRTIVLEEHWDNPRLWWPTDPNLYRLSTALREAGSAVMLDSLPTRFGFREFWTDGKYLRLNGVRLNMWGNHVQAIQPWWLREDHRFVTKRHFEEIIDSFKDINARVVRFHMGPGYPEFLDAADEKGVLIIQESALRGQYGDYANPAFWKNMADHLRRMVKRDRNHPCIVFWNAENEVAYMGYFDHGKNKASSAQLAALGQVIKSVDPTRPVNYDGDNQIDGLSELRNVHYPDDDLVRVSSKEVAGSNGRYRSYPHWFPPDNGYSIYMWRNASWDVPLGVGEFDMAHPWDKEWSPKRALMIRGFRYCDFFDIRPFWIYESTYPEKIRYWFRSSMSPVAVFDKAYDDQKLVEGPDGYFEPPPPVYEEGSPISRTLVIYNDEFFGKELVVKWQAMVDGNTIVSGNFINEIEPGFHEEQVISFVAPVVRSEKQIELYLSVYKGGTLKFTDCKVFVVTTHQNRVNQATGTREPKAIKGDRGR